MGIREERDYLKQRRAEREALKENAEKQIKADFNNSIIEREDMRMAHEAKIDRFYKYKEDVKFTLLKEALMNIYVGSFHKPTTREVAMCESLLTQYIQETGVTQLMKNMKFSNSALLVNIHENVNKYFKIITEDANVDDETSLTIKPQDTREFWDEIDKSEDIDDITNLIRMRVSNAEEEFVNKNQEDKHNINTVLQQTASRIQMAKGANDNDYSNAVEESESRLAKSQIYKIQHESHHNVFDRMVRNLSESAIKNEECRSTFIQENGRLDMDRIVESVRCMYTLLEMVGTIQLETVDAKYIEDTLKSIK